MPNLSPLLPPALKVLHLGTAETQDYYTQRGSRSTSESVPLPLVLLPRFKNYLRSFSGLKLFSSSLVSSYSRTHPRHSALWNLREYMLYIKLNAYITICRIRALFSIVKGKKIKIEPYPSFISKANRQSFMKCDVLVILLPEGMPDLCFPSNYYIF